jgi:nucleoid-associated protein YgaU
MGFDEEVDQLKRELQTPKLDTAGRKQATVNLCQKLNEMIQSKRLEFVADTGGEPSIAIKHKPSGDKLAGVFVNDDGSITFQSQGADEEGQEDPEDAGYFPPYVEYYDEQEFLDEAPEMLKQGVAEYELDQEEGSS